MTSNKALLVMDLLKAYVYGDKPLIPIEKRASLIKNIKKVIKSAHKKNIPVIFVNLALKPTDPIYRLYINYRDQALEGTREAELIDDLKIEPKDFVVKKRGFDGFWKSDLQKLLKKLKIKEIYLAGVQTDCCVRETAVTAAHLGYDVYVIEDCCQTSREFGQIAALRFLRCCTKEIITNDKLIW